MSEITIPPKAVEALRPFTCCGCNECLSKGITAALRAWPMVRHDKLPGHVREYLILPLSQETTDND